ncbi:class I SAM-dependent methyltransferase [Streptomyces sp. 372A]
MGKREREPFAEYTGGGQALDVGCGTGELAAYLASLGHTVDAVDFADTAVARAREEHADIQGVRWLCLDIERDDPAPLHAEGYDLVVMRMVYPFLKDRSRVLRTLGGRLRHGGALVVITPVARTTPDERRGISLDEDEIALLAADWEAMERQDAEGMAFLVLRGFRPPGTRAVEKGRPTAHALTGSHVPAEPPGAMSSNWCGPRSRSPRPVPRTRWRSASRLRTARA